MGNQAGSSGMLAGSPAATLADLEQLATEVGGAFGTLHDVIRQLKMGIGRNRALVVAERLERDLAIAGISPRGSLVFRAQFAEDAVLYQLFAGQFTGLCVEAGAFDGLTYSVSSVFESIGWDCLLVEGIPEKAALCAQARPHSTTVHVAIGSRADASKPGATANFTLTQDKFGGMLSYATTTALHAEAAATLAKRTIQVPLRTLSSLLAEHFPARMVDFVSLDIEGGEAAALDGLDLDVVRPRVLLVEDNHPDADTGVTLALRDKGYVQAGWVEVNRLYIAEEEQVLRQRAHMAGLIEP